jgi:hypothetical protein
VERLLKEITFVNKFVNGRDAEMGGSRFRLKIYYDEQRYITPRTITNSVPNALFLAF